MKAQPDRKLLRLCRFAALFGLGFGLSGCSFQLPKSPPQLADEDVTGSVPHSPLESRLDPDDSRRAQKALVSALDLQSNGAPTRWTSERTHSKGMFEATGKPYLADDRVCRGFRTEIIKVNIRQTFEGTACTYKNGVWTITGMSLAKAISGDKKR